MKRLLAPLWCAGLLGWAGSSMALDANAIDLSDLGWAAQPNLTVDTRHDRFLLSWQARLDDGCVALRVVEISGDGAFDPAQIREVARGCDWFVNWADVPAIAVAGNGDWQAHWLQRNGASTYAYDIQLSRSHDRGRTWSPPVTPHDDGTPSQHGFVSMAAMAGPGDNDDDRIVLIWLDGRNSASDEHGGHDHHGEQEGDMTLRSAIVDGQGRIAEPVEIDDRICSCCPTALVRRSNGEHLALYRDRDEHNVRDIALVRRTKQGWQHGETLHRDGWTIAGCPVNGPTLASREDDTLAAWYTMPEAGAFSVRYQLLGSEPNVLEHGSGVLGRVTAAAFGDGWLVAWLGAAQSGGATALRLARLDHDGVPVQRHDIALLQAGRDIGLPRLATLQHTALLVWTEPDTNTPRQGSRRPTRLRAVVLRDRSAAP